MRVCYVAMDTASNKNSKAFYYVALQGSLELCQPAHVH